jgi:hypothetical protein
MVEALLAHKLLSDSQRAHSAKLVPKNSGDISAWRFVDLINVAAVLSARAWRSSRILSSATWPWLARMAACAIY